MGDPIVVQRMAVERMTFMVVAHYRVAPDAVEEVESALTAMIEPTRAEPGNVSYRIGRVAADPAEFVLVEEYVDEAAFTAHTSSQHFAEHLDGVVLPHLTFRERFDVVPLTP